MLMARQRAESLYPGGASVANPMVQKLCSQLSQGLESVIAALENYSIAFEALTGMRGMFDIRNEI